MKTRFTLSVLLTACIALSIVSTLSAQENKYPNAKPMFVAGPPHRDIAVRKAPAGNLVQWNGSFTDITKKKVSFTMVGTDPNTTNVSTTIPVFIIPIKMVYGPTNAANRADLCQLHLCRCARLVLAGRFRPVA